MPSLPTEIETVGPAGTVSYLVDASHALASDLYGLLPLDTAAWSAHGLNNPPLPLTSSLKPMSSAPAAMPSA